MHHSRLAGFIIDCQGSNAEEAARFWSAALGMPPAKEEASYQALDASVRDLHVEVQSVAHESRVHLDIETDDLEAEVARLEQLGAKRVRFMERWWILEAPTGQRFCVVPATGFPEVPGINRWG